MYWSHMITAYLNRVRVATYKSKFWIDILLEFDFAGFALNFILTRLIGAPIGIEIQMTYFLLHTESSFDNGRHVRMHDVDIFD